MTRKKIKENTAIGNGLDPSSSNITNASSPLRSQVSTGSRNPHYEEESESATSLMGPGDGVPQVGGSILSQKYGWVGASGTSIVMDDTPGNETVEITHHSGATVRIDPDGSVFLVSSSSKGIGVSAPYGDAYMSAAGDIVLKGSSLSFDTTGDATFSVGGTFNLVCDAYKLTTNVMDETIDGSASRSVTNDDSEVIGGIQRSTVAGDRMQQTTGKNLTHVGGDNSTNVNGKETIDVMGDRDIAVGGDAQYSAVGTQKIVSEGDAFLSSSGNSKVLAGADAVVAGATEARVLGGSSVKVSAPTAIMSGDATKVTATGTINVTGGLSAKVSAPDASVHGNAITLGTGNLIAPEPSGSPSASIGAAETVDGPDDTEATCESSEAQIVPANDIVDSLTSTRKYPQFPGNGYRMSADAGSIYTVSHDSSPGAEEVYSSYSSQNYGNANPASMESYGSVPEIDNGSRREGITGTEPGISVPGKHNNSSKISRFFTLGALVNAKHSHRIPPSVYENVVKNHIYAAYNVLDPIKERFPNIIITSAYRGNSSNHRTGLAIDLVVESRSLDQHAEIARFVRDNLPVDQVFLERNTSGRTHVHIRASRSGATPTVLTCGDPRCRSRTSGISIEYLRKKGVR
jgi:hypothetical protein